MTSKQKPAFPIQPQTIRLLGAEEADASDLETFIPNAPTPDIKPGTRGWGEAAKDTGLGVMSGLAGLVKTGGDLYGLATGNMDNLASQLGREGQAFWEEGQSDVLKGKKQARKAAIDQADGMLGKFAAAAGETLTDPALLADTVATNVSTMIPGMAAGRAAAGVSMARAYSVGPLTQALATTAAKQAAKLGTGVAIGTGAVQQGADVSADVYADVMKKTPAELAQNPDYVARVQALMQAGTPEADAVMAAQREFATTAARATFGPAAGISVLANALPGASLLERAMVGGAARDTIKAGTKMALPKSIAKGMLGEGAQETLEEGGGAFAGNVAKRELVDPAQSLTEGVGENAGLGFAGGFALGGAGGAFHREDQSPAPAPKKPGDQVRDQAVVESGPLSRAANVAIEGAAQEVEQASTSIAPAPAPSAAPAGVDPDTGELTAPAPAATAPTPEPGAAAAPTASFESYEAAADYLSQQRRNNGSLPGGRWLPSPNADGSFSLVGERDPRFKEAEGLKARKAIEALGIQDGDILTKGGQPFKNRAAAAQEQRRRGIDTHDVVQLGEGAAYVVRPSAGVSPTGPELSGPVDTAPASSPTSAQVSPTEASSAAPAPEDEQQAQAATSEPAPAPTAAVNDLANLKAQWMAAAQAGDSERAREINEQINALKSGAAKAEAPKPIEGAKIDDEWTGFSEDSGTLGIPRAEMPQIKAEHRGAMVQFFKGRGIAHEQTEIPAGDLKPTQAEFSPAKVEKAKAFEGGDRSILVSADGHVLDGHHQWMAKRDAGEPVKVIRLDAPIKQLLEQVKEFPSAEMAEGAGSGAPEIADGAASTPGPKPGSEADLASRWAGMKPAARRAKLLGAGFKQADQAQIKDLIATDWTALPKPVQTALADSFGEQSQLAQPQGGEPSGASSDALSSMERDLRALARDAEQPGDVMLGSGKFVSLDQAKAAARAAIAEGTLKADAPFQYSRVLDIAARDWDRMVREMTATVQGEQPQQGMKEGAGLGVPNAAGEKAIGRRADGVMIREDARGVRFYAKDGVRISETVEVRPTRDGLKIAKGVLKPEFMTAEESGQNDELDAEMRSYERKAERREPAAAPGSGVEAAAQALPKWLTDELDKFDGKASAAYAGDQVILAYEGRQVASLASSLIEGGGIMAKMQVQKSLLDAKIVASGQNPDLTWRPEGGDTSVQDAIAKREKVKDDRHRARGVLESAAKEAEAAGATETAAKLRGMARDVGKGTGPTVAQRAAGRVGADIERELAAKAKEAEPAKAALTEREKAAKAKMLNAAGKLAHLLAKNTRASITPEQEQQMLPIVIELFEGAMELGYVKFKQAARYVREFVAGAIDQEAADSIPIDTLQGAYIATARRHADKPITAKKDVIAVDSIEDLADTPEEVAAAAAIDPAESGPENADQANTEEPNNERAKPGEQSTEALDPVAAEAGGEPEGAGPAERSDAGSGQAGDGGSADADAGGVPGARSGGSGVASVHPAEAGGRRSTGAVGGRRAGAAGRRARQEPVAEGPGAAAEAASAPNIPAQNFRINAATRLGQGGEVEKFNDNLAAIRILKAIEAEQRRATPAEQQALARYVGWGGLANAFPDPLTGEFKDKWKERGPALAELLTPQEYAAARRSTRNAHYTSQTVVSAMWDIAQRLGFKGGMALESSMGSGNFLGLLPENLAGTKFVGVEYDSLTARLAAALYPQATVLHSGFQKVPLPDNTFALAIGNPPFGSESLRFQFKPELHGVSIHNQFFRASLDAVRPGGLQIMVVSRFLMDAQDKASRLALAEQAELVGAIRLPDSAFKENARTEVVTDIIILKKRTAAEREGMRAAIEASRTKPGKDYRAEQERQALAARVPAWVETQDMKDPLGGEPMRVNAYFHANPSMVMGVMERSGSMQHGADLTVRLDDSKALPAKLQEAIQQLPEQVMDIGDDVLASTAARHKSLSDALRIALAGEEPGHVKFDEDGQLHRVIERETPEGEFEFARQAITADSPWSEQLYLDGEGRWYRLVEALDEQGNKLKKLGKDGKPGKLNEYRREVFASEADVPVGLRLGAPKFERLSDLVRMRDLLKRQLVLETEDAPKGVMEANRGKLAKAYEAYVQKHGFVNARASAELVSGMPDGALVLALEVSYKPAITAAEAAKSGMDVRKEQATPAPILRERVVPKYEPVQSAGTAADALAVTLAERGVVDLERIAALRGVSQEEAIAELQAGDKPLVFNDPETGLWVSANDYLSGQVKRKLSAAKAARLDANVRALEAVQPEPWTAENVSATLGATWVPPQFYGDFIEHLTGAPATVRYSPATNLFVVSKVDTSTAKAKDWGVEGANVSYILGRLLNSQNVVVMTPDLDGNMKKDVERSALAQLKAKELISEFGDWVFKDGERRAALVDVFNEKFNTRVLRQYDGSHLKLPGKVPDTIIELRRHQKNAVWRGITERFMLFDHVVGAGKTFTAIARAMERRRMGLARKPMMVVPNHLVEQFAADVYRLYPGAKVLAAGQKDFEAKRRRRVFAKIATGDWDIVIVPHSSFGFIGIAPETEARFLEEEMAKALEAVKDAEEQAREDGLDSGRRKPFGVKEAERLVEKIQARMDALNAGPRDRLLTFEQLGVDDLTVDEAHEFKNLYYSSRMTGVRGMGNKTGSRKAADLYNKVRVLADSPTGAVTFMTGTPISNSAVEMFSMMRYLAAGELRELGLEHFDAWRSQYVEATTKFEPTESGRLKEVNRLGRSWSNMRSLMDLYYSFTDSVSIDDIKRWYAEDNEGAKFPVPEVKGGDRKLVAIKPTAAQTQALADILEGFDGLEDIKDPYERNKARLRLMDKARKVSLDVRAVDPRSNSDEAGGKLERVADEVARIHKATTEDRGTQLVFLDRSVPKARGDDALLKEYDRLKAAREQALADDDEQAFQAIAEKMERFDESEIEELRLAQAGGWNAYQQIKDNLVARGVPAHEIRFVQEADTDAKKKALFDAVNGGQVRVLLGSTPRMGAGTNVQERLVALHHVDVTWKPSDIEQREGRIIRQGNKLLQKYGDSFQVELFAYATERTVDAKMWDLNATKLKTINAIRKYDGAFSMDFNDEDSVSMAEMAALASGNPKLLERVTLESELSQLELLERAHRRKLFGLQDAVQAAERVIARNPGQIETTQARVALFAERLADLAKVHAARQVTVEGKSYTRMMDAERAAQEAIKEQQGEEGKGRYAVTIDGKRLTSKDAISEAIGAALGDSTTFQATIDGQDFTQRLAAGRLIAEKVSQAVPKMERGQTQSIKLGAMMGWDLEADIERSRMGLVDVTLSLNESGRIMAIGRATSFEDSHKMTSTTARNALVDLSDDIFNKSDASRVDYMKRELDRARDALPEAKAKLEAAKEWPRAQEMATKRERLAQVITELSTGAPVNQAEANPQAEESPTDGGIAFNVKEGAYTSPHEDEGSDTRPESERVVRLLGLGVDRTEWGSGAAALDPYQARLLPGHVELEFIAEAFNTRLVGFGLRPDLLAADAKRFGRINGAYSNGHIYLRSTGNDRPHLAVLGHELAHRMAKSRPQLYQRFVDAIRPYVDQQAYGHVFPKTAVARDVASDHAKVREEFMGEVLSDAFMDREFWRKLGDKNPGLLRAVADLARRLIVKALGALSNKPRTERYLTDFRRVMDIAAEVMTEYGLGSPESSAAPFVPSFNMKDEPTLADRLRSAATRDALTQRLGDMFQSTKAFNWWHRTVGTQFHKAKVNPLFGRVYRSAQAFINDTSFVANEAADQAPDLLPKLDQLGDITKRLKLSDADQKAVAAAVFQGTLTDQRVYSPSELKSLFELTGEQQPDGSWDGQIGLYQQFRRAVDTSLDYLAAGEVVRFLGRQMDELPAGLARMVSQGRLVEFGAAVRRSVASIKDGADARLAQLKKSQQRERDNMRARHRRAQEGEGGRPTARLANAARYEQEFNDLKRDQGAELKRAQDAADLWEKVQFDIIDKFDKIENLKAQGYAPLMRFGRYTVDVISGQDGERLYFGMYDTQAEANAAARQLAQQFADEEPEVTKGIASQEAYKLFAGLNPETLAIFGEHAGVEQSELFEQYIKLAASNRSALTRLIKRKGIAGFSEDVSRVLAAFLTSNARSTAANLHMGELDAAVDAVPKSQGDVRDEAQRLRDYVRNPVEEAAQIRGLLFLQFMGGSVASALVNMTQPFAMTMPWLSQYGGPARAAKALGLAIKDAVAGVAEPGLKAALHKAEAEGVVSPSEIHQLQAEASRNMGNNPWLRKGVFLWGSLFQLAEKFNRKVTFMAAYRTAIEQGRQDAFEFASNAVDETQGVYSKANRPNWARGAVGATAFTFKQYSISYVEFLARLPRREKALALAVLVLLAGVQGLPGADDLDDIIDTLGQRLGGYDTNSKRWKRQAIEAVFGDAAAELVMRGLSTVTPVDIAGRMSVGNLIPGTGLMRKDKTDKTSDVAELAGPIASVATDVLAGLGALAEGKPGQALASMAPVAVKNALKALDVATTGAYRDTRGRTVIEADGLDSIIKAVGFQPSNVAGVQRRFGEAQQSIGLAKVTEGEISTLWAEGIFDRDSEKVAQARKQLETWNSKNPGARIGISMPQILRRVREMKATKEQRIIKAAPKEMRASVREQLGV